jgi:hypothetical protein
MSLMGVTGNSSLTSVQSQYQQVRNQFRELGKDVQRGTLTQAQTDFVSLSQSFASQLGAQSPVGKMLSSVGQALQSGNVSAAQQAFSSYLKVGPTAIRQHSHVPPAVGKLTAGLQQLGQALQTGDLSAAQQAYSAMQQVWKQMSGSGATLGDAQAKTSTTRVTA